MIPDHYSRQDSTVSLLKRDDAPGSERSPAASYPKTRDFLRQFRLQVFGLLLDTFTSLVAEREQPKVAIYRNRGVAFLHSLLHLAPLTGAVTLIVLHWTKHWLGASSGDSHLLQFIAKIHELLMQSSIVEFMLFAVRSGLTRGFVPLGALSGTLQATQVSYLWSLDYFSVMTSSTVRGWRKAMLVIGLPALIALTALVGPSSAVLMIPRAGSPLVVDTGKVFVDAPDEALYPSLVGVRNGLELNIESFSLTRSTRRISEAKPSYNMYENMDVTSYSVNYIDQRGDFQRTLRASVKEYHDIRDGSAYRYVLTANMTLPTRLSADKVLYQAWNSTEDRLSPDRNRTINVISPHPVTSTTCGYLNETKYDTVVKYIQGDYPNFRDLQKLGDYAEKVSNLGEEYDVIGEHQKRIFYPPVWIHTAERESNLMIGIVFSMPSYRDSLNTTTGPTLTEALTQEQYSSKVRVAVCTLHAHWDTGEVQWVETAGITFVQTASLSESGLKDAQFINLDMEDLGVFEQVEFAAEANLDGLYLAGSMAVALAEIPQASWVTTNQTEITEPYDANDMTTLDYTNTLYGYGYGVRTTSSYLSLTVMSVYCIITILYLGYSFFTGITSTAWSSGVELMALALQSSKPSLLGDSSVGIDSVKTFSQNVGVRVNTDNELELVFASDVDLGTRTLRKVERNKEY